MIIFNRTTEASKSSARSKYMIKPGEKPSGTRRIDEGAFSVLLDLDPTPNKKYMDTICKWFSDIGRYFLQVDQNSAESSEIVYIIFKNFFGPKHFDAIKSSEGYFLTRSPNGNNIRICYSGTFEEDPEFRSFVYEIRWLPLSNYFGVEVNKYYDFEKRFGDREWFVKGFNFKNFGELYDFNNLISLQERVSSRLKKIEPAILSFLNKHRGVIDKEVDTEKALVFTIPNYEISNELGKIMSPKAPWCVQRKIKHWNNHVGWGIIFYFFLDRTTGKQFYIERRTDFDHYNLWDEKNRQLAPYEYPFIVERCGFDPDHLKIFEPERFEGLRRDINSVFGGR